MSSVLGINSTWKSIMCVTSRELAKHGYVNLTDQSIVDEFEKSVSLIHDHYETKSEHVISFYKYTLKNVIGSVWAYDNGDPTTQLQQFVRIIMIRLNRDPMERHKLSFSCARGRRMMGYPANDSLRIIGLSILISLISFARGSTNTNSGSSGQSATPASAGTPRLPRHSEVMRSTAQPSYPSRGKHE